METTTKTNKEKMAELINVMDAAGVMEWKRITELGEEPIYEFAIQLGDEDMSFTASQIASILYSRIPYMNNIDMNDYQLTLIEQFAGYWYKMNFQFANS